MRTKLDEQKSYWKTVKLYIFTTTGWKIVMSFHSRKWMSAKLNNASSSGEHRCSRLATAQLRLWTADGGLTSGRFKHQIWFHCPTMSALCCRLSPLDWSWTHWLLREQCLKGLDFVYLEVPVADSISQMPSEHMLHWWFSAPDRSWDNKTARINYLSTHFSINGHCG